MAADTPYPFEETPGEILSYLPKGTRASDEARCPSCGKWSRVSQWKTCWVYGCETCGEHAGAECPECDREFDFVMDGKLQLRSPEAQDAGAAACANCGSAAHAWDDCPERADMAEAFAGALSVIAEACVPPPRRAFVVVAGLSGAEFEPIGKALLKDGVTLEVDGSVWAAQSFATSKETDSGRHMLGLLEVTKVKT